MNSFPLRRSEPVPHLLSSLAALLEIPAPAEDFEVRGIAPVRHAAPNQLGFLADARYVGELEESRAGAILVSAELESRMSDEARPRLVAENAHRALAILLDRFHPEEQALPEIHHTTVLGTGVRLGPGVRIGPYAVIEAGCEIGAGTRIGAHVVIGAGSRVGRDATLHPHAVLYPGSEVGDRVILHAGARVGVDGFGYVFHDGAHRKVPQIGGCAIEDDVEIGANTTIDRGSIGRTRVGAGAKLDNLVQVGHNAVLGPGTVLAGQVGVSGSAVLGAGVVAGGQTGIGGHLRVGDGARLAGQSGITGDVAAGATVMGFPARPRREFLRVAAAQRKVPELLKRIRRLEAEMAHLRSERDREGEAS